MDSTNIEYLGFVVAAFILIWAVIEFNRRLSRRNQSLDETRSNNWVKLDTRRQEEIKEETSLPLSSGDEEDTLQAELHARAKQNGHHVESQKPQI